MVEHWRRKCVFTVADEWSRGAALQSETLTTCGSGVTQQLVTLGFRVAWTCCPSPFRAREVGRGK